LHKVERHVEIARYATLQVPVEINLLHLRQTRPQTISQHADALTLRTHLPPGQGKRLTHAHNLVRGQRPGTHAALMPATVHLRLNARSRLAAHIQRTNTLRTITLVRGKTHQI